MPTTVKIRRSGTASATPSALEHGEIAINYADGKVFWKNASNVITSFTFQSYALASHVHAASDITSGTLDAARLPLATTGAAGAMIVGTGLGVSSGTVSVTYGTNSTSACRGDDSRLSDTRTPTDGSVTTAKIANDAVTYAKLQNVSATDRLLGRSSAGAGDVEEITCTAFGRSLIDDADAAAARTTLSVQPTASPAFTGAATFDNTGNVVPLTVTNAGTANSFVVNDASGDTSPFVIDASGAVLTGSTLTVRANSGNASHLFTYNENGGEIILYDETQTSATLFDQISTDTRLLELVNGSNLKLGLGGGNTTGSIQFMRAGYVESVVINSSGQLLVTAGSASACGVAFSGDPNTGLYSPGADELAVSTNQTERLLIDASGNIRINGAAAATSAVGAVHIKNGTAPSASITDGIVLFAADVSSFSELRVRDEAGNVTTLSPHAFPLIPEGPSEPMAWSYYSERDGRRINVDMLRVVRLLEQMTGEKLVYED